MDTQNNKNKENRVPNKKGSKMPLKGNKPQKPNSFWIYGLIILGIMALQIFIYPNDNSKETTFFKFIEMVKNGDVKKVEVINKDFAKVYIKKESKSKYDKLKNRKQNMYGPDFSFQIGDMRTFNEEMMKLKDEGHEIDPILFFL